MAIDWLQFDIHANETVRFIQPNTQAIALNRVTGKESSTILGNLIANGNVFILNPNGVLIGAGAQINVGGLIASTLNISNNDFEAGLYNLAGNSTAGVVNRGTITVPEGGKVALIAPSVINTGQINAPQGSVLLAAANGVNLKLVDGSPLGYVLTQGAAQALVDNGGMVLADGGRVVLTTKGLAGLNNAVINHSGIIQAKTVAQRNGLVELLGDEETTTQVSGTMDVSGQNYGDTGGTVKVLGQKVGLFDGARIDARGPAGGGTVLVGGNQQGLGPEPNASATYMAPTATIDASATQTGDGGKVVVWGTDVANVHGNIRAAGGAQGGNGGSIETSGHALDTSGIEVDVSAARGAGGLWLLDPYNVTISSGAQTGGAFSSNVWTPSASGSLVNTANIQTILNSGGNVTITTTAAGGAQEGNIAINGNIVKSAGTTSTLTLIADGRITSNGTSGSHRSITSTNGALNVSMTANATSTAAANNGLKLQYLDVTANGGNISLTASGAQNGTASALQYLNGSLITSGTGTISIVGTMPSNGNSQGVVLNSATLTTASGAISIQGTSGGIGTITGVNANGASLMSTNDTGVKLTGSNTLQSTAGGSITLTGTATGATSTWAGGGVEITAGDTISTTGAVTITGTTSNPTSTTYRNQLSAVNFAGNTSTAINVTGGSVSINGTNTTVGQIGTTSNGNAALKLAGKINITSTTGAVNLTGSNAGGDGMWGSGTANTTVAISAPVASSFNINAASLDSVNGYTGFYVGNNATLQFLTTAPVSMTVQTGETSSHNSIWNKGTISIPGNLSITSTSGRIYDDGAVGVFSNVGGTTSITSTGGGNTISLTNASNKFTGAVSVNAGDTNLVNSTALSVGTSSIAGALSLTAPGISQTGTITASGATTLNGGGSAISLTNTGNDFNTLSASNAAGVTVVDSNALGVTGITSTSAVQLTTLTQDLTTSGSIAVSNGNLTLTAGSSTARGTSTGGDVINNATLSVDSGKKIYVYTGSLASTSLSGSLSTQAASGSGNFRYNKQTGDAPGASTVGDGTTYVMYREQPTLTITPTDPSKVYDKNAATDPSLGYAIAGQANGDTASQILTGSLTRSAGQDVGSYSISQGSLADQLGYQTSFVTGHSMSITPATLSVSGSSAASKTYDGSTSACVTGGSLSGVVSGDTVTLSQSGTFDTKNVGTGKTVTETFGISGSSASNYVLASSTGTTTANITAATLSVSGAIAASKTYDGSASASVTGGALSGVVSGDTVTLSQSGSFDTKNVGTAKTVTETFGISGSSASNYVLASSTGTTTANITPATLSVSGGSAASKVYDGSTSATITGGTLSGVVSGDTVTLSQSGSFDTKNVGTSKTVTETFGISGSSASNYVLASSTGTTTANVTAATLSVSGATAASKTYDGSTSATITGGTLSGIVSGDTVTLSQTGSFDTKNVGTSKTVTGTFGISGSSAGNYVLVSSTATTTANITPAQLTVTANDASRLVGINNPAFSATYSGFVAGEAVGTSDLSGKLIFDTSATSNSAPGRYAITPSGWNSSNYQLHYETGTLLVYPASLLATALGLGGNELGYTAALHELSQPESGGNQLATQNSDQQADCGWNAGKVSLRIACRAK